MMRARLQHLFHPLNLWCRIGGRATKVCRFYEKVIWGPFLRRLLNGCPREAAED